MSANHSNTPVHHHAHHFNSAEHEFETSKEGMWIFLVTEVLMIGALFVGYLIFRGLYPEAFHAGHKLLSVPLGTVNTLVLLTSSLTMVMGVSAAQRGDNAKCLRWLGITVLFGFAFLIVKYFEYSHKIHMGTLPGGLYTYKEAAIPHINIFFSFYFMMTGVHAFHVVLGMGLITWVMTRVKSGEITPAFYTPVELVGFYWHFVDLVWIYLFPMLYLLG